MITQILSNTNPYTVNVGINQLVQVSSADTLRTSNTNDICYCAIECEYKALAFAEVGGEDYKNDFSSFLFRKIDDSDSISFELHKSGVKIADLNDNTLGTYYPSFTSQPLQTGFIISWESVLSVHGSGVYRFISNQTILGESVSFESRLFKLAPYSDYAADKTVKIKGVQTGDLLSSPFVFADLIEGGWPFYVRVRGYFQEVNPEVVKDFLDSSDYNKIQIQDQIISKYELTIYQAPKSVLNLFLKGAISIANNIFVTDYNIMNDEIYRNVEVDNQSFNYEPFKNQRKQDMTLEMNARKQNILKRNF